MGRKGSNVVKAISKMKEEIDGGEIRGKEQNRRTYKATYQDLL